MFEKFQFLYQHIKSTDVKLFETLNKISDYLETLFNTFETTADNKVLFASPTAALVLPVGVGASAQVPGMFLWVDSGTYLIQVAVDFIGGGAGDVGQIMIGELRVGNLVIPQNALLLITAAGQRATVFQQARVTIPGRQKISLFGYKTGGAAISQINVTHTTMIVTLIK